MVTERGRAKQRYRPPRTAGGAGFSPLRTDFVGCHVSRWFGIPLPARPIFRLVEPLAFNCQIGGELRRIVVPRGYQTDFASVPRCLWWIYPPTGPWAPAAVVHDWLYTQGEAAGDRAIADAIFREGMRVLGVSVDERTAMYLAVRVFGGSHFGGRT